MPYFDYPVAGSPLIPYEFWILYASISLLVLSLVYLAISLHKAEHPWQKFKKTLHIGVLLKFFVLILVGFFAISTFAVAPEVVDFKTETIQGFVSVNSDIEMVFSRPVSRRELVKKIEPDIPGLWIFDDFIYATHLARRVSFYPSFGLEPDTKYTISLENISNVSGWTDVHSKEFHFSTEGGSEIVINKEEVEVLETVSEEKSPLNKVAEIKATP